MSHSVNARPASSSPAKGRLLGLSVLFLAVIVGLGVWLLNRQGDPPEPAVDGAARAKASAPPAAEKNPRIPQGEGTTTSAGKFVPAGADPTPPADRSEAEARLREALEVEELSPGKFRIGKVEFDANARTAKLPASVNLPGGIIEYVLTTDQGKVHESMLTTSASPRDLHMACLLMGMKGAPLAVTPNSVPAEAAVKITVSWETNGPPVSLPLSSLIRLAHGGPGSDSSPMPASPWHYNGSVFYGGRRFAADAEGSLISLISDGAALLNNPTQSQSNDDLHIANTAALPRKGFPVTITIALPPNP